MKNSQVNRVINLVRKTGDRVIVMDQESEEVLVMMRFDEYENLMDFALPSGDNDPTPDFSQWDDHDAFDLAEEDSEDDEDESLELGDSWSQDKTTEPAFAQSTSKTEPKLDFEEPWTTEPRTTAPEEDLSDVPEDETEPRFYLEPIE